MNTYAKLFSSIVHSTIWREPDHVRVVWITMLALADRHGQVAASVPGLADISRVPLDLCRLALEKLMAPDPDSRSKEFEGRRIAEMDGGWLVLNYVKHRDKIDGDVVREQTRQRVEKLRQKRAGSVTLDVTRNAPVTLGNAIIGSTSTSTSTRSEPTPTNGTNRNEQRTSGLTPAAVEPQDPIEGVSSPEIPRESEPTQALVLSACDSVATQDGPMMGIVRKTAEEHGAELLVDLWNHLFGTRLTKAGSTFEGLKADFVRRCKGGSARGVEWSACSPAEVVCAAVIAFSTAREFWRTQAPAVILRTGAHARTSATGATTGGTDHVRSLLTIPQTKRVALSQSSADVVRALGLEAAVLSLGVSFPEGEQA